MTDFGSLPLHDVPWLITGAGDGRMKVAFSRLSGIYYAESPAVLSTLRAACGTRSAVNARYDLASKVIVSAVVTERTDGVISRESLP
jgi:hypothetical protein